jgi:hypothetical protein
MKSRQQVDGGAWQSSGATVSGLLVGDNNHTVNFNTVFGWVSPTNEAVSISPNSTTTATGTYVPIIIIPGTGSLQVNISPAAAVTAGAKWQVDGGAWQNSGAAVANLAAGNHMVSFNMVSGWTTPANQAVSVSANSTTTASGTYIVSPPPALSGIYIIQTNSTSVVFGIPQALSTNYSVSGYYIANGVTNSFPGTGAGPSIWGIIGLRPITAYTFWFHVNDLVNYVHGADVSTNVTTLPVPTLQGLSVEATNSTSIVFQIPQALSTNYGVGGYYVAGGVTNIFPGTGYGPNICGV